MPSLFTRGTNTTKEGGYNQLGEIAVCQTKRESRHSLTFCSLEKRLQDHRFVAASSIRQAGNKPYYAIDETAHGRWSGSTHVRDMGDTNASGETVGYSIVQKWETRLSNLLDRFGCGHVSSIGDNDLASEIGYTPPKH